MHPRSKSDIQIYMRLYNISLAEIWHFRQLKEAEITSKRSAELATKYGVSPIQMSDVLFCVKRCRSCASLTRMRAFRQRVERCIAEAR
jgi:hypothetical protein